MLEISFWFYFVEKRPKTLKQTNTPQKINLRWSERWTNLNLNWVDGQDVELLDWVTHARLCSTLSWQSKKITEIPDKDPNLNYKKNFKQFVSRFHWKITFHNFGRSTSSWPWNMGCETNVAPIHSKLFSSVKATNIYVQLRILGNGGGGGYVNKLSPVKVFSNQPGWRGKIDRTFQNPGFTAVDVPSSCRRRSCQIIINSQSIECLKNVIQWYRCNISVK